MKNMMKDYCKYFLKSNRRFLIVEFIILFVGLPLLQLGTPSSALNRYYVMGQEQLYQLSRNTFLFALVLAVLVPIFLYRFLYKRRSADLYFSLPITRKQLFFLQYIYGLLVVIVPLCFNYLLSCIILLVKNVDLSQQQMPIFILQLLLFTIFLYTLITFIIMKCNNMFDTIMVSAASILLPLVLYIIVGSFLTRQVEEIFVSYDVRFDEVINLPQLLNLISIPACSFENVTSFLQKSDSQTTLIMYNMIAYWGVVSSVALYFAQKAFVYRKEEDIEQRTTSAWTYPLIICVSVFALVLYATQSIKVTMNMLMSLVVIFVVYMIMIFVWKRKINIKLKEIVFFILICAGSITFSTIFQNTNGFHMLKEIPNLSEVESVSVDIMIATDSEHANVKNADVNFDENYFYKTSFDMTSKKEIQKIQKIQKKMVAEGKQKTRQQGNGEQYLYLTYTMKDESIRNRAYAVYNTKLELTLFDAVLLNPYQELTN